LLATLHKNFQTDLHEIFSEDWQWASEQMIKFWWQSGPEIQIHIARLVKRALAEVCTVSVLLLTTGLKLTFYTNPSTTECYFTTGLHYKQRLRRISYTHPFLLFFQLIICYVSMLEYAGYLAGF